MSILEASFFPFKSQREPKTIENTCEMFLFHVLIYHQWTLNIDMQISRH